jgi:hypothetical protein
MGDLISKWFEFFTTKSQSVLEYVASLTNGNEMMAAAICLWALGSVEICT